jgi:hypothetical protein
LGVDLDAALGAVLVGAFAAWAGAFFDLPLTLALVRAPLRAAEDAAGAAAALELVLAAGLRGVLRAVPATLAVDRAAVFCPDLDAEVLRLEVALPAAFDDTRCAAMHLSLLWKVKK